MGLYWFRSKCGWRLYLVSDSRLTPTATTGAHDAQHHPHKQHNHMQQHIPAIQPRRASQPRPRGKHIAQPRHPLFTVNQSAPRLARRLALIRLFRTRGGSAALEDTAGVALWLCAALCALSALSASTVTNCFAALESMPSASPEDGDSNSNCEDRRECT